MRISRSLLLQFVGKFLLPLSWGNFYGGFSVFYYAKYHKMLLYYYPFYLFVEIFISLCFMITVKSIAFPEHYLNVQQKLGNILQFYE